jgi:hypothetical protein
MRALICVSVVLALALGVVAVAQGQELKQAPAPLLIEPQWQPLKQGFTGEPRYWGDQFRSDFQRQVLSPMASYFPGVTFGAKNRVTGATWDNDDKSLMFQSGLVYPLQKPDRKYLFASGPPLRGVHWWGGRLTCHLPCW